MPVHCDLSVEGPLFLLAKNCPSFELYKENKIVHLIYIFIIFCNQYINNLFFALLLTDSVFLLYQLVFLLLLLSDTFCVDSVHGEGEFVLWDCQIKQRVILNDGSGLS